MGLTEQILQDLSVIEEYEKLSMDEKPLDKEQSLVEYNLPKETSRHFTYHKFPIKGKKNKWQDDGICKCCGKRGTYLIINDTVPPICYNCYISLRAYRRLWFDYLKLQKKKNLTLQDCKKIVSYMKSYSKKKAIATLAIGAMLLKSKR